MKAPSICIPRITDNSITKEDVANIFNKYKWGPISRIDFVTKNNNTRAFIHYDYWNVLHEPFTNCPIYVAYINPQTNRNTVIKLNITPPESTVIPIRHKISIVLENTPQ